MTVLVVNSEWSIVSTDHLKFALNTSHFTTIKFLRDAGVLPAFLLGRYYSRCQGKGFTIR